MGSFAVFYSVYQDLFLPCLVVGHFSLLFTVQSNPFFRFTENIRNEAIFNNALFSCWYTLVRNPKQRNFPNIFLAKQVRYGILYKDSSSYFFIQISLLLPVAPQLSCDVPVEAGFLCNNAAELQETIEGKHRSTFLLSFSLKAIYSNNTCVLCPGQSSASCAFKIN